MGWEVPVNHAEHEPLSSVCHSWHTRAQGEAAYIACRRGTAQQLLFGRPLTGWAAYRAALRAEAAERDLRFGVRP